MTFRLRKMLDLLDLKSHFLTGTAKETNTKLYYLDGLNGFALKKTEASELLTLLFFHER